MPDVVPNYKLEQMRLRMQIQEQRTNIERQRFEIMQMADRAGRHRENIAAAAKAIEDYQGKLAELEKTHGALTEQDIQALSTI